MQLPGNIIWQMVSSLHYTTNVCQSSGKGGGWGKEVVLRMVHLHITPFDPPDRYCDVTAKTQREGR